MKRIVLLFVYLQFVVAIFAQLNTQKIVQGCYVQPPTNVKCFPINGNSILVSWDPVSTSLMCGSIINYEVYIDNVYYTQSSFSTQPKQTVTGLQPDKLYSIKVKVLTNFGPWAFSQEVAFKLVSKNILSENFNGFTAGTANSGVSGTDVTSSLNSYLQTSGWTGVRIYQAGGTAKVGASATLGYITTSAIDLSDNSGSFNIKFDAMAWKGDSTSLKIFLNDSLVSKITGLNNDSTYTLKSYNIAVGGGKANSKIRFEGNQAIKGRFFLENLIIYQGQINAADLQVSSIDVPATMIAERKATINATIINKGNVDVAAGKSFVNRLYWSKDATFNKNIAGLLASQTLSGGLLKDASQSIQFAFTAPYDSVNQIRFFVETDALDSIFELDQTNNIANGNWLKLKANTIQNVDYAVLKNFYASVGGSAWATKWNTASNVINSTNWYGVSFNEGYVTSIALPSNNITATFPVGLGSLDSLTTLQLAGNKLFGEIPALTNQFRALKNMNLSYNKFTSMAGAIPASVSNLNVSYQQFLVDSLHLSISPTISLPQILNYNHSAQAFSTKPAFVIYDGINPVGNLGYNVSNEPEMSWYNADGWHYKSGKIFTLTQNNGSTYGSNAALKIYYNYGDANVDRQISILDVQHTLNYMLGEPATPFNFSAADTYCDTLITVQDIVSTINILLNEVVPIVPVGPPEDPERIMPRIKATYFSPATVYIADKKLMLKTTMPVAAFDVTVSGLTETQLQHQLADYGFSVITRKQKDGSIRFVAFSASGSEIPVGNTCIAYVNSENVQLKQVVLSNKQAQTLDVEVSEETNTGIDVNGAYTMAISSNQAKVNLKIPSGFETVDVVVYNPQGVEIAQRKLQTPMVGSYQFDFGTDIRMQGVYFIKVVAKSNKITSTINSKIIVSK